MPRVTAVGLVHKQDVRRHAHRRLVLDRHVTILVHVLPPNGTSIRVASDSLSYGRFRTPKRVSRLGVPLHTREHVVHLLADAVAH